MSNQSEKITEEQTGKTFILTPESWYDVGAAWVSIVYSVAVIVYLSWFLLDMWTGEYSVWFMKLYKDNAQLNSPIFKLVVYTAIGGGMGAAVNNIRSFVGWHAELKAFGWRFVWKYISMPPLGAILAVMVYALLRSGIAVISGSVNGSDGGTTSLSAWVTGALAGYGSHTVFIWLDDKVNTLFKVEAKSSQAAKVPVPDVSGKTQEEAAQTLQDGKLALGDVSEEQTSDGQKIGKVISQTPKAGTEVAPDSKVSISIGKEMGLQAARVAVPDLSGKTREEAAQTLQDGKLVLGDVSTGPTSNEQLIGKVISQTPVAGAEAAPDSKVAVTIGTASDGEKGSEAAKVAVPDVSGKTQEEAAQALKDGKLALGDVSTGPASDEQLIGKVISQIPAAGTETAPESKVAITIGKASDVQIS